jgi:NADH dehydrogenase
VTSPEQKTPHVVIVGGGFGGLSAAKALAGEALKVTLIDKKNYHLFQPLLYQVATAALSPAEIAYPLRGLLARYPNITILMAEVLGVNKEERRLETSEGELAFDYLVLACGSTYTYFGHDEWAPFAPGLKTIAQATEIRRRIFLAFEKAEVAADRAERERQLTFVVVGGGPTGVELAGSIGEITRYSIHRDFAHINSLDARILLLEAGPRVLPSMSPDLSAEAARELQELGVEIRTDSRVTAISTEGITVGGELIPTATILWAAGVAANPLNKKLNVELDPQGRVMVSGDLSLPSHPDIFVIGDQAHYPWGPEGKPLPGLAPVAMQQGRFVARVIERRLRGQDAGRFRYIDKGQMATIGRSRAVAMYQGLEFQGFVAWVAWLLVHIYYLIGFKNKLFVLFQWAWTYLTFRRGARLIIDKE